MHRAIVMAGGQGLHLWPLTATRPKPLVRIAARPVMAHILAWLRRHGITEVLATQRSPAWLPSSCPLTLLTAWGSLHRPAPAPGARSAAPRLRKGTEPR
jgi:molybdopterin-guanine dinucleotide biosynthesis protein A